MLFSYKKIALLATCLFVAAHASDSVIITNPADSATVNGTPLTINGTASRGNYRIRLTINTTEIGSTLSNGGGNWNFTLDHIDDGNYTITADLVSAAFEIYATTTNSFTVDNGPIIKILSPLDGDTIAANPLFISGSSSEPSTTVALQVDANPVVTTTTDAYGNWEIPYTFTSNGSHTLAVQLLSSPVANDSITIDSEIPVIFSSGITQVQLLNGIIPTSGSGTGAGYTYSVSGSVITINFTSAFGSTPVIIATGKYASGTSNVTITSVSTTSATLTFSASTEDVHFVALLLS